MLSNTLLLQVSGIPDVFLTFSSAARNIHLCVKCIEMAAFVTRGIHSWERNLPLSECTSLNNDCHVKYIDAVLMNLITPQAKGHSLLTSILTASLTDSDKGTWHFSTMMLTCKTEQFDVMPEFQMLYGGSIPVSINGGPHLSISDMAKILKWMVLNSLKYTKVMLSAKKRFVYHQKAFNMVEKVSHPISWKANVHIICCNVCLPACTALNAESRDEWCCRHYW